MILRKESRDFDQKHFIKLTKRRFRKKFKKSITATDINTIWKNFVQYGVVEPVLQGDCVKIDKHSTLQVIGVPMEEDSRYMSLLRRGRMMRADGRIKKAGYRGRRGDVKYAIVYTNRLAKSKIIFKACKNIKKQLVDTLNNTNVYFQINHGKK